MKIIDILNKKANGTLEDGFKFCYENTVYTYNKNKDKIFKANSIKELGEDYIVETSLNDEIEVKEIEKREENKEIEELNVVGSNIEVEGIIIPTEHLINDYIIEKTNELVRVVNKLIKEREEK